MLTGASKAWIGNSSNVPIELSNPNSSGASAFVNGDILLRKSNKTYTNWYLCNGTTQIPSIGSSKQTFVESNIISIDLASIGNQIESNLTLSQPFAIVGNYLYFRYIHNSSIYIAKFGISGNSVNLIKTLSLSGNMYEYQYTYTDYYVDYNGTYVYYAKYNRYDHDYCDIYKLNLSNLSINSYSIDDNSSVYNVMIGYNLSGNVILAIRTSGDDLIVFDTSGKTIYTGRCNDSYDYVYQGIDNKYYTSYNPVVLIDKLPYRIDSDAICRYYDDTTRSTKYTIPSNAGKVFCTADSSNRSNFKTGYTENMILSFTNKLSSSSSNTLISVNSLPKNSMSIYNNRSSYIPEYDSDSHTLKLYTVNSSTFKDSSPKITSPVSGWEYYVYVKN